MLSQPKKWDVRIEFVDGSTYAAAAWAYSERRAYELALIDARMAGTGFQHVAKVGTWSATLMEAEPA